MPDSGLSESTPSCKRVVVAIHGTFSPRAAWARCDSQFAEWIKEQCVVANIVWTSFRWSGANTHKARENAAKELIAKCAKMLKREPNCKFVLIAHSHGGNVALMALNESSALQNSTSAVVCMATPFITAKPRNPIRLHETVEDFVGWLLFFVGPSVCLAAGMLLIFQTPLPPFVGLLVALLFYYFLFITTGYCQSLFSIENIIRDQKSLTSPYIFDNLTAPAPFVKTGFSLL